MRIFTPFFIAACTFSASVLNAATEFPIVLDCRDEQNKISLSLQANILTKKVVLTYKDELSSEGKLSLEHAYFSDFYLAATKNLKIEGAWDAGSKLMHTRSFTLLFSPSSPEHLKVQELTYREFHEPQEKNVTISFRDKQLDCEARGL